MADNWQLKAVISANAEGMLKALKNVNNMTKDTRKYLADVANTAGHLSGKIGLPFAAIGALVSGFSLAAIKGAVSGFAEMGESIYKGSLRAGMSVEQYQRMKYVADQAGLGIEAIESSVGKLNKNIGMAAAGKSKDLAGLFTKLGISTRDANGQLRSGMDILPEVADAFERNKNPVVQARMGMALFGKSWQEVIPLLMEGSAGINESMERMKRLKGVMGADDINGAREFGKSLKDMDMVMKGFQMTIAKSLVPVLKPLIDDLVTWFAANKKLVSTEVTKMAKELAAYLKTIDFKAVIQGVGDFFSGLGKLVDMVGGTKNALIALVFFMNLQTIMAFVGLIGSVGKLIWSLGAMSVGAIPAALSGIRSLTLAMAIGNSGSLAMIGTVGTLIGQLGLLAAAFTAGYAAGTLLYDKFLAGTEASDMIGAGIAHTLAFFGNDEAKSAVAANSRQDLIAPQSKGRVDGQVNIKIDGLPPGSRVDQQGGGNMPINLDAGYSSFATGMAM